LLGSIFNWREIRILEDGCGGSIYKVVDQDNSNLKNLEMAMCIFTPGEMARLHHHAIMEEIYFIIEGTGRIEIESKWYPINPEDAIAIPVGVMHRIHNTSMSENLRFISVNSPEWQESDMIFDE
jgi:mannose-6-phosphate isomerase-like protein (cupin superfamily)